ncbi:putative quinol monooxygenase [Humibacter soli]
MILDAQPGKSDELAAFLIAGREIAITEHGTVTWYAFKLSETRFGVFDTFETAQARQAHIDGEIPKALAGIRSSLLAADPIIEPVDIVAAKPAARG